MKRTFGRWSAVAASAAVAGWLLAVPLAAQDRTAGAGPRGGEGGGARATAGGGGGGSVASGGSASGGGTSVGSSGGGGGSTSSGGSVSSPGNMSGGAHGGGRDFSVPSAGHERGSGSGQTRGGGSGQTRGGGSGQARTGGSGGGQTHGGGAVARQPMGGTPSGGATSSTGGGRATVRDGGTRSGRDVTSGGGSVPPYSRPRGDKPAVGTAVPRTHPAPPHDGAIVVAGYPWYYPWGFGGLGYYGLYDPWYDPWGYDPYGGQYPIGGSTYDQDEGSVHLKVKPREAEVYVDGYYTGRVDEFDGVFQRLHIVAGPHRIELRAPGYEPLTFDIRVEPHHTLTFKGELKKIQ